jgi:hypothetical protein
MTFARKVIRSGLVLAGMTAIAVAVVALNEQGGRTPQAWMALAAVLAVLASIVSAWGSQRVIELQENVLEPNVRPSLDFRNRYQLAQFRVANRGGSAAYDVRITWDNQLKTVEGLPVQIFGPTGVLPVLLAGDEATILLGQSHDFLKAHAQTTWSGTITYDDATGERRVKPFNLTAEHERLSLVHNEEEPKTHFELQKIPDRLEDIAAELSKMRKVLMERLPPSDAGTRPPSTFSPAGSASPDVSLPVNPSSQKA